MCDGNRPVLEWSHNIYIHDVHIKMKPPHTRAPETAVTQVMARPQQAGCTAALFLCHGAHWPGCVCLSEDAGGGGGQACNQPSHCSSNLHSIVLIKVLVYSVHYTKDGEPADGIVSVHYTISVSGTKYRTKVTRHFTIY